MSIKKRIALSFFVPAIVLTVFGAVSFLWFASVNVKSEVFKNLVTASYSRANHVESYLAAVQGRVIDFTSDGKIRDCISAIATGTGCTAETLSIHLRDNKLPVYEDMMEVLVLNKSGTVIGSTVTEYLGSDMSQDPVYLQGVTTPMVSDLFYSETVGKIVYRIAAPVSINEVVQGVVVVTFLTDDLYAILSDTHGLGQTGEIYLVGPGNVMLSPSRANPQSALAQTVNTVNTRECFQDMRDYVDEQGDIEDHDEMYNIYTDYRNIDVLGTHAYVASKGWCLIAEIDESEAAAPVRELSLFIIANSLFIITCAYGISLWISRQISRPIVKMTQGVEIMQQGHLDIKVGSDAPDELGALGRAFDALAEKYRKSIKHDSTRNTE